MNNKTKGANLHKAFPKKIQKLVRAMVQYENYNEEYLLVSILSAAASAAGNAVQIRIKGEWVANPALYTMLVGNPGAGKSQPIDFAYKPIRANDKKHRDAYVKALEEFEKVKRRNGAVVTPRIALTRTIVSDFTPEALMSSHAANPRGITIYVDEIMGMFNSVNQYSKGQLIEQLLTAFSGKSLDVARVSMEMPLHIEHPCISIVGSTQTARIEELIRCGYHQNGLLDRFLFSFPMHVTAPLWDKRKAKKSTKEFFEDWNTILTKIIMLPYNEDEKKWCEIPFTRAARDHFYDWHNEGILQVMKNKVANSVRDRMMKTHLIVARLALVIQLLRWACGEAELGSVDLYSLKSAIQINDYFDECYSRIDDFITLQQLNDSSRTIYEGVEKHFSTSDALKVGTEHGISKRNVMYCLSILQHRRLVEKKGYGKYQKVIKKSDI